jgi:hypothetical protein
LLNTIIEDSSPSAYVSGTRRYRLAKDLTLPENEKDLAYVAGLLDGPGTISWRDVERRYWSVKVTTSDREIIDYLLTIGGTWSQQLPKNRRRVVYQWDLSRQEHVRDFLVAVAP